MTPSYRAHSVFPRLLPRNLDREGTTRACACAHGVCLQGGAVARAKQAKTATVNLREILHNPRTTAVSDKVQILPTVSVFRS